MNLPFDAGKYPHGVKAGDNKLGFTSCPFCNKDGDTEITADHYPDSPRMWGKWFLFTDYLSAREYVISGICQSCQNEVFSVQDFGEPEE